MAVFLRVICAVSSLAIENSQKKTAENKAASKAKVYRLNIMSPPC
jgi:hypothetical protein